MRVQQVADGRGVGRCSIIHIHSNGSLITAYKIDEWGRLDSNWVRTGHSGTHLWHTCTVDRVVCTSGQTSSHDSNRMKWHKLAEQRIFARSIRFKRVPPWSAESTTCSVVDMNSLRASPDALGVHVRSLTTGHYIVFSNNAARAHEPTPSSVYSHARTNNEFPWWSRRRRL
jgi:hypothetical protein